MNLQSGFFEGTIFGLDEVKVDEDELESDPDDIDDLFSYIVMKTRQRVRKNRVRT